MILTLALLPFLMHPAVTSNATSGSCSPIVNENKGSVTIECRGLDPAVALQLAELIKAVSDLNKRAAQQKDTALILKILKQMQMTAQSAKSSENLTVNGDIQQNSMGDCSPNIVGNNVSNECLPRLHVTKENAAHLSATLKDLIGKNPWMGSLKIAVNPEMDQRAMSASSLLYEAFHDAGLNVKLYPPAMLLGCAVMGVPGITLEFSKGLAENFANTLAPELVKEGILKAPIEVGYLYPGDPYDFGFCVRKP